ncbi:MAG: DUF2092 domain-containing protein [Syntrophobacteraceae bacterium]
MPEIAPSSDGKAMVAFAPAENVIAVAEAPPTIDETLKAACDSAAIYFPFTDLIVADPCKDIADGLVLAFYIGQSKVVGGTTTDMVAYANNECHPHLLTGPDHNSGQKGNYSEGFQSDCRRLGSLTRRMNVNVINRLFPTGNLPDGLNHGIAHGNKFLALSPA